LIGERSRKRLRTTSAKPVCLLLRHPQRGGRKVRYLFVEPAQGRHAHIAKRFGDSGGGLGRRLSKLALKLRERILLGRALWAAYAVALAVWRGNFKRGH
jgi:hypothetical protein